MRVEDVLKSEKIEQIKSDFLNRISIVGTLKGILSQHPDFGPGHLIFCLMGIFGVTQGEVSCIGGWWPGGKSELSDQDIEPRLKLAIEEAYRNGKWS